ncbi:MAG: hypothetical protein GY851_24390 [bacterium]|nr:hypothetical protein [bacterium]
MSSMKRRTFLGACTTGITAAQALGASESAQAAPAADKARTTFVSSRADGRFMDTAGFMQAYMKGNPPKLAFHPDMNPKAFPNWRGQLREKLLELLVFPDVPEQPAPKRLWSEPREGYRLEKWEAYPEPYSVVPFLMLVPDGVTDNSPAPAVMCFPGSTLSKENLAGEPELPQCPPNKRDKWKIEDNRMALHFVRQGIVAVAFDNPATCETQSSIRNRVEVTTCAIWTGRNYLGVSVFQKVGVLEWLARQPYVDKSRIATCGHSLGSDPADCLGVLYPDLVKAVIHNDFCCDWRERTIAMNAYPGGLHHVVPGMYAWFDAPDLQASLAPRPLLFTEGGRTPHLNRIRAAYRLHDAEDNLEIHYYDKYATPDQRPFDDAPIPEGLSDEEYFQYANVDVPFHCFRPKRAVPWLAEVFGLPLKPLLPSRS